MFHSPSGGSCNIVALDLKHGQACDLMIGSQCDLQQAEIDILEMQGTRLWM